MFATPPAHGLVAVIALIARLGLQWTGPAGILLLNGFFIACLPDRPGCFSVLRVRDPNGAAPKQLIHADAASRRGLIQALCL
jgi:hypothetical protein